MLQFLRVSLVLNKNNFKIRYLAFILLVIIGFTTQAQDLTPRQVEKFNKHFFEAERLKLIDQFDEALVQYQSCLGVDANNAVVRYEIAGIYFVKQNFNEALVYAKEAVVLDESNKWYRIRLIEILTALGDKQGVISQRKYLVSAYPERLRYKTELVNDYLAVQEYNNCIEVLNDIENLQGFSAETVFKKRDLYIIQLNFPEARNEMENLVEYFPENIEYMGALAQFYMTYGPKEKVEPTYLKMLELAPNDPRAHLDLANFYRQQGKIEESTKHLKIAVSSPELSIDPKVSVLLSFYDLGDNQEMTTLAYELLDSMISVHPEEAKTYSIYADFLVRDDDLDRALEYLKKARQLGATQRPILEQIMLLDIEANNYDSLLNDAEIMIEYWPNQPVGYLMKGLALIETGELNEAVEILEYGLLYAGKAEQVKEQFYIYLADAYRKLEDHNISDQYLNKALALNPNNASVLNNYAYYLSERGEQLDKALEMAEKGNALSPKNYVFLDTWAWVLYKRGEYSLALKKINQAIKEREAVPADLLDHKGDILFKLNKNEEAIVYWKKALEAGGGNEKLLKKINEGKLHE